VEEYLGSGQAEWEIREALFELQRYLSDQIAPLMFVEAFDLLLLHPPELTATEIQNWTAEQHTLAGNAVPTSDYLFHGVKKLHLLSEYKLISEATMTPFLEKVATLLFHVCPEGDRELFVSNVRRIKSADTFLTSQVAVLHRQTGAEVPLLATKKSSVSGVVPSEISQTVKDNLRRFGLLLRRLEPSAATPKTAAPPTAARTEAREHVLSEMLSLAARQSRTSSELDRFLARLGELGMDARIDRVFRTLSGALPGWAIPVPVTPAGTDAAVPKVGAVEAMHQIVALSAGPAEVARRFHEMVRAAVEQFNEGELGRAVTMLDLAERLVSEKQIDPERADMTRRSMHEIIDADRLRTYAEDASRQMLLRRVLGFFPTLSPHGILAELETEQKRERRRLLVTLLQVHGGAARRAALDKLREPLNPASGQAGWYFQRNLLNVLRRIPRTDDSPLELEIEVLTSLGRPGQHILLIKEIMANFAMLRHEKSASALIAVTREYEALAGKSGGSTYTADDLQTVVDRAYSALARIGTTSAIAAVVEHGLSATPALGETTARLAELSTVDLSGELTAVARLVAALRKELPRKVFGFVIARKAQNIEWIVRALSSTPTPEVRRLFREIAQTYPDQSFAKAAAVALDAFDHASPPAEATFLPSLSGDLELFGMPNLLQNLAQSEVTGVLTLTDRSGETAGILTFDSGKLAHCRVGVLRGKDAIYQLFENPAPGTFSFINRRDGGSPDASACIEILPLIFEGSRRYDELRQVRALIPEGAPLVRTSIDPTQPEEERDPTLVQGVFAKIGAGATPEQCETDYFVDSFRIYRLLAHWLEEGSLAVGEQSATATA
jgi:hypothetical protein